LRVLINWTKMKIKFCSHYFFFKKKAMRKRKCLTFASKLKHFVIRFGNKKNWNCQIEEEEKIRITHSIMVSKFNQIYFPWFSFYSNKKIFLSFSIIIFLWCNNQLSRLLVLFIIYSFAYFRENLFIFYRSDHKTKHSTTLFFFVNNIKQKL